MTDAPAGLDPVTLNAVLAADRLMRKLIYSIGSLLHATGQPDMTSPHVCLLRRGVHATALAPSATPAAPPAGLVILSSYEPPGLSVTVYASYGRACAPVCGERPAQVAAAVLTLLAPPVPA